MYLLMTVTAFSVSKGRLCVSACPLHCFIWDLLYSSAVLYHLLDAELLPRNAKAEVERIRGTGCQLCTLFSAQNFNPSVSQGSSVNIS